MASLVVLLSVLASACFVAGSVENSQLCDTSSMQLMLTSHFNRTGKWQSQVVFKQNERLSDEDDESGQWKMDVHQTSSVCEEGKSTLETTLYLTAPVLKPLKRAPHSLPVLEPSPTTPPPTKPPPTTPPPTKPPPQGYTLFEGVGYYKFHHGVTTWTAARDRCAAEGGHLVIINSQAEREVVRQLFAVLNPSSPGSSNPDQVHVGLQRVGDRKYATIFGVPIEQTGFSEWFAGQPSSGASEPCISIMQQNISYNDISCSVQVLPSICEFPMNKPN